jgi:hypothetical protein
MKPTKKHVVVNRTTGKEIPCPNLQSAMWILNTIRSSNQIADIKTEFIYPKEHEGAEIGEEDDETTEIVERPEA